MVNDVAVPGRRDRKKQQTRAALMEAALRLVAEHGLDNVTVEAISEAADVSPRTFFNYFASKDEAVIGEPFTDRETFHSRLLAEPAELPLLEAFQRVLAPDLDQIQAERDVWLLRMRVVHENPALLHVLFTRGAAEEEQSIAAIGARTGLSTDSVYPHLAASVIGAAVRTALMRWAVTEDGRPLTDFVREAFGHLAAGLEKPTPTTEEAD